MTQQNNEAFEKWYEENWAIYSNHVLVERAWQAAKADSEREIAELKERLECMQDAVNFNYNRYYEAKAHINVLREALNSFDINDSTGLQTLWATTMSAEQIDQALSATPAESLIEHDNELIERCARAVEPEDSYQDDWFKAKVRASEQVRALKGKQ